jgi:hypothetical protein
MYLLPHVCIKNIFDLPDAWKKNGFQWSVDKMVSYLIGGVMVSILALSVLDPWDRAPVWSSLLEFCNLLKKYFWIKLKKNDTSYSGFIFTVLF